MADSYLLEYGRFVLLEIWQICTNADLNWWKYGRFVLVDIWRFVLVEIWQICTSANMADLC